MGMRFLLNGRLRGRSLLRSSRARGAPAAVAGPADNAEVSPAPAEAPAPARAASSPAVAIAASPAAPPAAARPPSSDSSTGPPDRVLPDAGEEPFPAMTLSQAQDIAEAAAPQFSCLDRDSTLYSTPWSRSAERWQSWSQLQARRRAESKGQKMHQQSAEVLERNRAGSLGEKVRKIGPWVAPAGIRCGKSVLLALAKRNE